MSRNISWVNRLIKEEHDLNLKISKLEKFINRNESSVVIGHEYEYYLLMVKQLRAMKQYDDILKMRIVLLGDSKDE